MADQTALQHKIEELKAILRENPKSTSFVALADAYRQAGQTDDALETALRGTWELPQFPEGFSAVGRVYAERKVFRKAEEAFYKALAVDQMHLTAYKGLARIYREQGDLQKASDILTKAIMLDPSDQSLQRMIDSLAGSQDRASAEQPHPASTPPREDATSRQSAGMKPITTATIADIYVEQGLYDKALEVYRELLADKPDDPSVRQKISELEALMSSTESTARTSGVEPEAAYEVDGPETGSAGEQPELESSAAADHIDQDGVIEKLSAWLESIQARRNRV